MGVRSLEYPYMDSRKPLKYLNYDKMQKSTPLLAQAFAKLLLFERNRQTRFQFTRMTSIYFEISFIVTVVVAISLQKKPFGNMDRCDQIEYPVAIAITDVVLAVLATLVNNEVYVWKQSTNS